MISFRRLRELGELPIAPVVVATINDHAADRISMTANPFRSGLNNHVRTMFERTKEITGSSECIVDDQWEVVFACKGSDSCEVGNVEAGVTDRFEIKCLCFFVDQFFESLNGVAVGETRFDTQSFECYFELVVGPAVERSEEHTSEV